MKKSDYVPDYLIDSIVRHAEAMFCNDKNTIKYINGERLLKKEIKRLETYKRKKDGN